MEGKTHRYLAFTILTLILAIMNVAYSLNWKYLGITLCLMILSSLCYNQARYWTTEMKKTRNGNLGSISRVNQRYFLWEIPTWFFLFLNMIITVAFADFLPEGKSTSISMAIIGVIIIGFSGATFPDWDWDWGEEAHRSPFTHSWIIPFSIWVWGMAVIPYEQRYINFLTAMFCVSYATHLFSDCVQSDTTGFLAIIKSFFDFRSAPGDIRKMPESWEHLWLFISGSILGSAFGFSLPRVYGLSGFRWDISNPQDPVIISLLIIGISSGVIWFLFIWKANILRIKADLKKKKDQKVKAEQKEELRLLDRQLPAIKENVVKIFQAQPVISTRALLFKALEKASEDVPVEDVYKRLKSEKFIVFNKSSPSGFTLASDQSKLTL